MTAPRCPRCGATWDPDRERALCGAKEDGTGCVPATEATMRWCRKHGIEPMSSVRCSLRALELRARKVAAIIVFAVLAVVATIPVQGQQLYCHDPGVCWEYPSPLGLQCATTPNTIPCQVTIPTPTPTPTPTKTPTPAVTPTPYTYTVTEFLKSRDLGYSYVMAMTMLDGAVFLTGGICCPGLPDPALPPGADPNNRLGECQAVIDYAVSPPAHREFVCTSRDSSQMYEVIAAQVAHSDRWRWVVAGENTFRPATAALQVSDQASNVWGFGVQNLTDPWFTWKANVGRVLYPEYARNWPLAILDLDGMRWLYVMRRDLLTQQWSLLRFSWSDAYNMALWTATTQLGAITEALGPIAIDVDGSLVSTIDVESPALKLRMRAAPAGVTVAPMWYPSSAATKIRVVRSRDQGRTWSDTGMVITAPAGKTLWGCGWEHRSGGAATIPWHLLCVISTGKGPEVGDWNGASVRFNGAIAPANFGQKPVLWIKPD